MTGAWAVKCPVHGYKVLSKGQYKAQLYRPDDSWTCPKCGRESEWAGDDTDPALYGLWDSIPF